MNKWTACTAHSNNPQHYPCVCICAAEASTLPLCLETSMFIWSRDLGDGLWGHPVYQLKVNCSTVLTLWFNLLYRVDSYSGHGEGKKNKNPKNNNPCSRLLLIPCVMWTSCWSSPSHRQGDSLGKDQLCKKNPPMLPLLKGFLNKSLNFLGLKFCSLERNSHLTELR